MIKILAKFRYVVSLLILLGVIATLFKISSIRVDTDFSQFLAENDPEYEFYKNAQLEIRDDESLLIIAVKNEQSIYNRAFLKRVNSFTEKIKKIPQVNNVKGLIDLSFPVKSMLGLSQISYLTINDTIPVQNFKKRIGKDREFTQFYINNDGTVLFIWVELKIGLTSRETENALQAIQNTRREYKEIETYIWGKKYVKSSLDKISQKETLKNIGWSFLFLIAALFFIFKKIKAVLSAILIVLFSIILFEGGMIYFNRSFGLMSNLYPTIILIAAISDFIHLSIKYNEDRKTGIPANIVFANTVREIGWAIFITSFTTAIGFFTLISSPMKALSSFGLEAGIAVISTFAIIFVLSPLLFQSPKKSSGFELNDMFIRVSHKVLGYLIKLHKYPRLVVFTLFFLLTISFFGIQSINTNNSQYSIPNKSEIKSNYLFFEEMLGGSRTFELYLTAKNQEKLNSPEVLAGVEKVHSFLDSLPYLNAVKSPILYYRALNRAFNPNSLNKEMNLNEIEIRKYENDLDRWPNAKFLLNKNWTMMKFSAQMKDVGRINVAKRNYEILSRAKALIDTSKVGVRLGGLDYLFDRTHEQRIHNMLYGLLFAILIVAIVLALLYKNIVFVLLALLLNIIPIILTAGIMGFTNIELRAGTSIIFTIAFVIAVDDTIHLLSKFQWERKKGKTVEEALSIAIDQCGAAILATSIVLIGAFFVLMLSDLNEIFAFGFLTGTIIILTAVIDLVLAPILILNLFKKYL